MADTPIPVPSAGVTWNPADKRSNTVLSNNDRTTTVSADNTWGGVRGVDGKSEGAFYFEVEVTQLTADLNGFVVGLADKTSASTELQYPNLLNYSFGFAAGSDLPATSNSGTGGTPFSYVTGDVIGVAADFAAGTVKMYKNNTLMTTRTALPANTWHPYIAHYDTSSIGTANFALGDMVYEPPAGYSAWGGSSIEVSGEAPSIVIEPTGIVVPPVGFAPLTWNPLDKAGNVTLSNGDRTATTSSGWTGARATSGKISGQWYFEVYIDQKSGNANAIILGLADDDTAGTSITYPGAIAQSFGQSSGSSFYANGVSGSATAFAFTAGDTIGFAHNYATGTCYVYKNNVLASTVTGVMTNEAVFPAVGLYDSGAIVTISGKTDDLTYSPPAGYSAWDSDEADPGVVVVGEVPTIKVGRPPAASSTKWRLLFKGNNGGSDMQVTEVQMRTSLGGADACTGGTPTADSVYSGSFPATNAFDNSTSTRWLPTLGSGQAEHWLEYEFASAVTIVEYTINALSASNQPTLAPRTWWLQYWDGAAWVAADFRFDQGSWGATETREFTVSTMSPPLNVCYGGTVSASSEYNASFAASNVFNNGTTGNTHWATGSGVTAAWIEYDFGSGVAPAVHGYRLQNVSDYTTNMPKNWTLEYYDGSAWQVADTRTNETGWALSEARTYAFSAVANAQRWRLNVSANNGATDYIRLRKMFMYAADGITIGIGSAGAVVTGQTPIIDQGTTAVMVPNTASAALTTASPAVDVTMNVLPVVATVSVSMLAPLVAATDNRYSSPGSATLAITMQAPAVLVVENFYATPASSAASVSSSAPTALIGRVVAPSDRSVSITGSAATLVRLFSHTPDPDGLITSGQAPTLMVSVGEREQPGTGVATVAGSAPSVALGIASTPSSRQASLGGVAPTLRFDMVCSPGSGSIAVAGSAPSTGQVTNVVCITSAVYVRPVSTAFNDTWTVTGAATHHEAVDEVSVDNSDYISGASGQIKLGLQPIQDPGFDTGHTLRCIAWCATGGGWLSYTIWQGGVQLGGGSVLGTIQTDPIPLGFALTEAQVAAITNYGALEIQLWSIVSGPVSVSWAALEIVGVTTKLGVATSAPTVSVARASSPGDASVALTGLAPAVALSAASASGVVSITVAAPSAIIGRAVFPESATITVSGMDPGATADTRIVIVGNIPLVDSASATAWGLCGLPRAYPAVGGLEVGVAPAVLVRLDVKNDGF